MVTSLLDVIGELSEQRDRLELAADSLTGQLRRQEAVTRVYLTFVENIHDDHAEDMTSEQIREAAGQLLAEMY